MNCIIYRLTNIRQHPNIPHLDIADCGPHQVVVGKHYDEGVLGIFIPDGSIVPDKLAEEMWVKGKLAGKKGNRVKARERDGVYTAGLFYGSRFFTKTDDSVKVYQNSASWNPDWKEGDDVTAEIGITRG